jgi:hypothetical protein
MASSIYLKLNLVSNLNYGNTSIVADQVIQLGNPDIIKKGILLLLFKNNLLTTATLRDYNNYIKAHTGGGK